MGFSTALHAAILTSLERLPVRPGGALSLRLTVSLQEAAPNSTSPAGGREAVPAAPAPVTTVPDPYLTSRQVDAPAVARDRVPLIYPENPFLWKLRGTVRLRVFINEFGTVDRALVVYAHPPGDFEAAALEAVGRLSYDPAIKNGKPVKSQKLIEVTFDPDADLPPR